MKILTAKAPFNIKHVMPDQTMLAYWRQRASKNLTLPPIFAVVHTAGSVQPEGYIQTWSIDKGAVTIMAKSIGGKTAVVKIAPPKDLL